MQKATRLLCALCALPLLNACVSLQTPSFEQGGRFSVSYTTDDGVSHTESGRFQYRELGDTEQLDLLTPLNGILARIEVKPNMTCLSKSVESTPVCRASAAELLYSILGFSIPVEHFGDLIKTGKLPLSVEESYVWQVQVKSKHPDGRAKLLQVTPKVPLNVRSLSVVTD